MPNIYLINLDKSADRLIQSASRLAEQNIEFKRLPAVLGSALSDEKKFTHYNKRMNKKQYYYDLSAAQIGCYLSHRKAWEYIATGSEPFGIVLEDDFILNHDLNSAITAIEEMKIPWEVIKLSAYANRARPIAYSHTITNEFEIVIHKKPISGGAATAITKEAAQRMLDTTQQFGRPCDTDMQYFWERGIEIMSLMPFPVAQDLRYESTISDAIGKQNRRPLRRLWLQIHQYMKNNYHVKQQVAKFKRITNKTY